MTEQVAKYGGVFDDYLIKPIELKELISSLIKFLPYSKIKQKEGTEKNKYTYAEEFSAHLESLSYELITRIFTSQGCKKVM